MMNLKVDPGLFTKANYLDIIGKRAFHSHIISQLDHYVASVRVMLTMINRIHNDFL